MNKEMPTSKHESPLRQYFRIRPVIVEGEPEAQRIEFHVGNQSFAFGPEYCESMEHAEWFVTMGIKAMHNAFKGMCNKCDGHGYVDEGDPESGPCPTTCDECGGKGKITPVETTANLGMDTPWPLSEVLAKLLQATDHLLTVHGCDTHGHEEFRRAVIVGNGYLTTLRPVEPTAYWCPNCANAGCTDCRPETRNHGPVAPGGVGVTDLAARSKNPFRAMEERLEAAVHPEKIILCGAIGPSGFICERPEGHPGRHCDSDSRSWSPENGDGDETITNKGNTK